MFSNILLEKLIRPSRAGGGLNESYNQISQDALNRDILEAKARYAPLTAAAQAASQMAYANLMGPQFAAKLLGNENILANIKDPGKRQAIANTFLKTGILTANDIQQGVGSTPSDSNNLNIPPPAPSLLRDVAQGIKSIFSPSQQRQQSQSGNAFTQPPVRQPQGRQPQGLTPEQVANQQKGQPTYQGTGADTGYSYDKEGRNVVATNEEQHNAGNQEPTFAENVGTYKGVVEKGKKAGEYRADDMHKLGQSIRAGSKLLAVTDSLGELVTSPTFIGMRQLPFADQHELAYYARKGTPEQQNAVGRYKTEQGMLVQNYVNEFSGRAPATEIGLALETKPNDADMPNVATGKVESIHYLTKLAHDRDVKANQLMRENPILDLADASEAADRLISGPKIRQAIHNKLYPQPTEADIKTMSEKYKVSKEEIKKRLRKKGYKI